MENKIFYCYSKPLKDFLVENGERFFTNGLHSNSKKKFWVFNGTEKLNDLLDTWRVRKH